MKFMQWYTKIRMILNSSPASMRLEWNAACTVQCSTQEVVDWQTQMNDEEKRKLKEVLNQNTVLFEGKLGLYPKKKFHIKLNESTKLTWQRPFPIPYWHEKVFVSEVDEMIKDRMLQRIYVHAINLCCQYYAHQRKKIAYKLLLTFGNWIKT